jgi:DNA-binding IclR family transcriptional regulator
VLETIVRDGWHLALEDIDVSAFARSAAIRDHTDTVGAALSIAGPDYRLNDEAELQHRRMVLDDANCISRALR